MTPTLVPGWKDLSPDLKGGALALGNFDGVHLGHRQVIAQAAKAARALDAPLGVISFQPHPRRWFRPEEPSFRLMTLDQQMRALGELGVERFHLLPFDAEMAQLSDEAFARDVLAGGPGVGLGVRHVAAGFDITFGAGRTGDPAALRAYGEAFGFGVSIAEPIEAPGGGKCSSTAIRAALRDGRPEEAAEMLCRPFAISGVVVHGDKLGRTIGYPTANVLLEDYVQPAFGVYAMRTRLPDGRVVPGVGYVGDRPTVNGSGIRLEVSLFDFDEDLYGQRLETELVAYLRGDAKFASLDLMITQMNSDAARARAILTPPL